MVGASCDANFNCRALLWDHGVMIDLNSLIPPGSPLYLTWGGGINDRERSRAPPLSKHRQVPGFLGDSCASGANRWRFARKSSCPKTSARRFSDDCAFGISEWPDGAAMTCKRGADNPCLARLRTAAYNLKAVPRKAVGKSGVEKQSA